MKGNLVVCDATPRSMPSIKDEEVDDTVVREQLGERLYHVDFVRGDAELADIRAQIED